MNLVCCGEDFFIDSTFVESKNKVKIPAQKVAQSIEKTKKKGLFSKQTKKVRFNYATNEEKIHTTRTPSYCNFTQKQNKKASVFVQTTQKPKPFSIWWNRRESNPCPKTP